METGRYRWMQFLALGKKTSVGADGMENKEGRLDSDAVAAAFIDIQQNLRGR